MHWKRNGHIVIKEWVLDEDLKKADESALRRFEIMVGAKFPGGCMPWVLKSNLRGTGHTGSANKTKKKRRRQPQGRSSSPPIRDAW